MRYFLPFSFSFSSAKAGEYICVFYIYLSVHSSFPPAFHSRVYIVLCHLSVIDAFTKMYIPEHP